MNLKIQDIVYLFLSLFFSILFGIHYKNVMAGYGVFVSMLFLLGLIKTMFNYK